jgi:hypothetical protein
MNYTIPATITITNNGTEDVGFRYFRVNFTEVLAPAGSVTLTAGSSEEAAYYAALADAKIGLTVAVAQDE